MTPPYPRVDNSAPCTQNDPELFMPDDNRTAETYFAKALCKGYRGAPACDFLDECLTFAVHHNVGGVWGGTSEDERRRYRRRNGIRAIPLEMHIPLPPSEVGANSTAEHGSYAAIGIHRRRKEALCDLCREYQTATRRARKQRAAG